MPEATQQCSFDVKPVSMALSQQQTAGRDVHSHAAGVEHAAGALPADHTQCPRPLCHPKLCWISHGPASLPGVFLIPKVRCTDSLTHLRAVIPSVGLACLSPSTRKHKIHVNQLSQWQALLPMCVADGCCLAASHVSAPMVPGSQSFLL